MFFGAHLISSSKIPNRSTKEWSTQGIKRFVELMIEFLRISPSYELARRVTEEKLAYSEWQSALFMLYEQELGKPLDEDQKISCELAFQKILESYSEFGDIRGADFNDWWGERGIRIFASDHAKPCVRQITQLNIGQPIHDQAVPLLNSYFNKYRVAEGMPPALLLSVPLGISKKSLLSQISQLIDKAGVPVRPKTKQAKKPLAAKRLRALPLYKALTLLWLKAIDPSLKLWELGIRAKVSPANARTLNLKDKKATYKNAEQRAHLSILTSRMLLKAKMIAENAARGDFPSSKKVMLPFYDYSLIARRLKPRIEAMRAKKNGQSV